MSEKKPRNDNEVHFYTAAVVLGQVNPCEGCQVNSPEECHKCTFRPSGRVEAPNA
jgi:hypothetical protein